MTKKKRSKKESILEAATLFFAEKGFQETSMKDIARVTGVVEGTIFYHFRTKEELFVAVLQKFKEDILRELGVYLAGKEFATGLDMMEGVISFYLFLAHQMEEKFLLLHRHYPYRLAQENPDCRQCLEALYTCFIDVFERAIVRGKEDGSIRPVPEKKMAMLIFTLVDGLVRLETYNLYRTGILYNDLIQSCRVMLENSVKESSPPLRDCHAD